MERLHKLWKANKFTIQNVPIKLRKQEIHLMEEEHLIETFCIVNDSSFAMASFCPTI